eukprot:277582-Pyramimonas_sp.AAC.1
MSHASGAAPHGGCYECVTRRQAEELPAGAVHFVETVEQLAACCAELAKAAAVGLDAEWRPSFMKGHARQVAPYIPTLPTSDWSIVRTYPGSLRLIGPS